MLRIQTSLVLLIKTPVGVDDVVSKNTSNFEIGPSSVTLSRSEGSVALCYEMLSCGSG
jgi:hypothetical protein